MQKNDLRKGGLLILWLLAAFASYGQYTVTGGQGTPLQVSDATTERNKIQVYLVNGVSGVEISYTASSASTHQWYRYKTKALEREKVASTQNGATSTIRDVEDGYGYYVEDGALATSRFVWITDYSRYAFKLHSLRVSAEGDPCNSLVLNGTADMKNMYYQLPSGGMQEIKRQFEVTYNTLEWSAESKLFSQKEVKTLVTGNPFLASLDPPFCDTDIRLSGDLFARHFNIEQTMTTGMYEAVAIDVHAEMVFAPDDSDNLLGGADGDGISAPAEVRFVAYANTPVAAMFKWKIYKEEDPNNLLVQFPGEEVDYTFDRFGQYVAQLEVSDRTGQCVNDANTFTVKIVESGLEIPNVFSPGTTPGMNDEFKVAYKSLVRFKGWIFNRWGQELFHWTDPSKGWDGKKGGKYVSPGVYYYVIEAEGSDGERYKKSGDVNILRPKMIDDEVIKE